MQWITDMPSYLRYLDVCIVSSWPFKMLIKYG